MLFSATIEDGKLSIENKVRYQELLSMARNGEYVVEIKRKVKKRSQKASDSLHLYLEWYAEEAEKAGLTVGLLTDKAEVPWSKEVAKELWRAIQIQVVGKKSTTKITGEELNKIHDIMNMIMTDMGGPYVPFPSIEQLYANS